MNEKQYKEIEKKFKSAENCRERIDYFEKCILDLKWAWKNKKSRKFETFVITRIATSGTYQHDLDRNIIFSFGKDNYDYILGQLKFQKEAFEKALAEL